MTELMLKYFVLKPKGEDVYAKASRTAMHAYARVIRETNPEFSAEIADWASLEGAEANFGVKDS